MTISASQPIHLEVRLRPERLHVDQARFRGAAVLADRARTILIEAALLLAVVFAVPVAIVVVGTPIALAIVASLQVGRWALNAF